MAINVGALNDLQPGNMMSIEANDNEILIANVDGTIYAVGNTCTHMGCSLSEGTLKGNTVECPCHSALFDLQTGKVLQGSATAPIPVYKVILENGQISVDV